MRSKDATTLRSRAAIPGNCFLEVLVTIPIQTFALGSILPGSLYGV